MLALHDAVRMAGAACTELHLLTLSPNEALTVCRHCAKAILPASKHVPMVTLLLPSAA